MTKSMKEQKLVTIKAGAGENTEKNPVLRELLGEGWVIKQFTSSIHPDPKGSLAPLYITILLERTKGE